jgi:hypothetical protein
MSEQTLLRIAELAGSGLRLESAARGWPGIGSIDLPSRAIRAALHVGPIGLSHRDRDAVERRFQNPGTDRPIVAPAGEIPLLLGLWEEGANRVLVAFEAARRLGKPTRFSLFIPLWLLEKAAVVGWAEHLSASDESVVAFHPALLPVYVEMLLQGARVSADTISSVLGASGLVDSGALDPEARARRAAFALVRDAGFGRQVIDAYEGRCAMCGLNLGLCQGAHIYPVSAARSPDEIWNALALCSNHHAAFDKHILWVEPDSRVVRAHPRIHEHALTSEPSRAFLASTLPRLREPLAQASRPRAEMFVSRYEFFDTLYAWAN